MATIANSMMMRSMIHPPTGKIGHLLLYPAASFGSSTDEMDRRCFVLLGLNLSAQPRALRQAKSRRSAGQPLPSSRSAISMLPPRRPARRRPRARSSGLARRSVQAVEQRCGIGLAELGDALGQQIGEHASRRATPRDSGRSACRPSASAALAKGCTSSGQLGSQRERTEPQRLQKWRRPEERFLRWPRTAPSVR